MGYIRIYNDTYSPIILHGLNRDYTVAPANESRPGSEDLPEEDVLYIASKSSVFERGTLRMEDDVMAATMEKMRKPHWRDTYLTQADIESMLLHPTYEGMMRVVQTTSNAMIERYRGVLVRLQNEGKYGVSERVERVVRQRWQELRSGKVRSEIKFPPDYFHVQPAPVDPKQAALEAELARVRAELEAVKAAAKKAEVTKPETTKLDAAPAPKTTPKPAATRKAAPKKAE